MFKCQRCGCNSYHAYDIGHTGHYNYIGVLVICNYCGFEKIVHTPSRRHANKILQGASSELVLT